MMMYEQGEMYIAYIKRLSYSPHYDMFWIEIPGCYDMWEIEYWHWLDWHRRGE